MILLGSSPRWRTASCGTDAAALARPSVKRPVSSLRLPAIVPPRPSDRIVSGPVTVAAISSRSSSCALAALKLRSSAGDPPRESRPSPLPLIAAAARRPSGKPVEDQPRPGEARPTTPDWSIDHAGDRAFDPRIVALQRAADLRVDQAAADVGADRHRARQVEHLDPRQPPQGVGRPGIAKLREHRRVHQRGDHRPAAQRREARLRPADRLAVADRDRAHRRIVARQHRGKADVDRLRRQHQPGAAEPADLEVGAAAGRPPCQRIIEPPGGDPAEVEVGPDHVEQVQRHLADSRRELRAASRCGRESVAAAAGEAHVGRREPPAVALAGQHRRAGQLERPPLDLAAPVRS